MVHIEHDEAAFDVWFSPRAHSFAPYVDTAEDPLVDIPMVDAFGPLAQTLCVRRRWGSPVSKTIETLVGDGFPNVKVVFFKVSEIMRNIPDSLWYDISLLSDLDRNAVGEAYQGRNGILVNSVGRETSQLHRISGSMSCFILDGL
jgi:hypothetical protein